MDFETYDAFSAGVEPGGLRNKSEIKLLICFLLESLDKPLTKEQVFEIMLNNGLANYFDVSEALGELVESGKIRETVFEENEVLRIAEEVIGATKILESDIPKSVREKALHAAVVLQTKARRERENKIEVETLDNGYHVTFTISDKKDVLMRLTVYVADYSQVETVKRGFLDDPVGLYSGIITALTA